MSNQAACHAVVSRDKGMLFGEAFAAMGTAVSSAPVIEAEGYYSINTKRIGIADNIGIKTNSGAVFCVPVSGDNMYSEDMYSNKFSAGNNNKVEYSAYNVDIKGNAKALVFYRNDTEKEESDRNYMVVSDTYSAINSDNESANMITCYK